MKFDFRSEYQNWTDAQLRGVLRNGRDFQPEAVAAAEAILMERGAALDEPVSSPAASALFHPTMDQTPGEDILNDFLQERTDAAVTGLVRTTLALVLLFYAYVVLTSGYGYLRSFTYMRYGNTSASAGMVIFIVVRIFFAIQFARRRTWGWTLVVFDLVLSMFSNLVQFLWFASRYGGMSVPRLTVFWPIVVELLLLVLLQRGDVRMYFGVPTKNRWWPLVIGGLVSLLLNYFLFMRRF